MKRILQILAIVAASFAVNQAYAQVGIGTENAHRSSVLELKAEGRGLLIPRVALTKTDSKSPIHHTPEHSLLVYNTATANDVEPGFYYWVADGTTGADGGYWEAFMTNKNLDNKAGDGIYIDEDGKINIDTRLDDTSANHTTAGNQFLVTVDDGTSTTTQWVDRTTFLNEFVNSNNGITKVVDAVTGIIAFQLGGDLTETSTSINVLDKEFIINANSAGNFAIQTKDQNFSISGIDAVVVDNDGKITSTYKENEVLADTFEVMILDKNDNVVQTVSVADLLKKTVEVESGLHYDTDGKIKLGGTLTKNAEIVLDKNNFVLDAKSENAKVLIDASEKGAIEIKTDATTPNLEITGLKGMEAADTSAKSLVIDQNNMVRTVEEVVLFENVTNLTLANEQTYNPFTKVVYVEVKVSGLTSEATINLPTASSANNGQVVEVKIVGDDAQPDKSDAAFDLVINGGSELGRGAVVNQKWTIRSFGTTWKVVSNF